MRYRSGYCALIVSLAFLVQMGLFSSSCRKPSTTSEPGNAAPASPGGINGRYVAGVKRFDGVAELFKLDITRQGNDVSGVLDFLSSMLDSKSRTPLTSFPCLVISSLNSSATPSKRLTPATYRPLMPPGLAGAALPGSEVVDGFLHEELKSPI